MVLDFAGQVISYTHFLLHCSITALLLFFNYVFNSKHTKVSPVCRLKSFTNSHNQINFTLQTIYAIPTNSHTRERSL